MFSYYCDMFDRIIITGTINVLIVIIVEQWAHYHTTESVVTAVIMFDRRIISEIVTGTINVF